MDGWIKLHRSLLEWEWYSDVNTRLLFIHLLLSVNYEDKEWRGITIKRGQLVYSRATLAKQSGLSEQGLRTALRHLISTKDITNKTTPQYSIITISNYDKYQSITNELTNDQPAINQPPTNDQPAINHNIRNKEIKNIRNKEYIPPKSPKGFDEFWKAYPRKQSKASALKAFNKINPDSELLGAMLTAIKRQKASDQWQRDGGQYIPYPATWLNGRRWEDEGVCTEEKLPEPMVITPEMDTMRRIITDETTVYDIYAD